MRRFAALALVLAMAGACKGSPDARPKVKAHATTTTASTTTSTSTTSTTSPSTASTSVALARPCTADDLGIAGIDSKASAGQDGFFVELENLSSSPCSLAGYPTALSAETPDGQQLSTFTQTSFGAPSPGNLPARVGGGLAAIETPHECTNAPNPPPERDYKQIRITLPGGGTLSLGDFTVNGTCGLAVSQLGVAS